MKRVIYKEIVFQPIFPDLDFLPFIPQVIIIAKCSIIKVENINIVLMLLLMLINLSKDINVFIL